MTLNYFSKISDVQEESDEEEYASDVSASTIEEVSSHDISEPETEPEDTPIKVHNFKFVVLSNFNVFLFKENTTQEKNT